MITFSDLNGVNAFFIESTENAKVVLSASVGGTWRIGGFALTVLKESGYDTLILKCGETSVLIPTESAAGGSEYDALKSEGVGERRMEYRYSITDKGECVFSLYADDEEVTADGKHRLLKKEEGA